MLARIVLATAMIFAVACIDDTPIDPPPPDGRLSDADLGRIMRTTLRRDRIGILDPDPERRGLLAPVYHGQDPTHVQISIRTSMDDETRTIHTSGPIPIQPLETLEARMENIRIDLVDYAMKEGMAMIEVEW